MIYKGEMIMSAVTLAKSTDNKIENPFFTRQWQATVDLAMALGVIFGAATGDRLYRGLADNNPRTLADTFAYWTRYDNTTGELVARRSKVNLTKATDNHDHQVSGADAPRVDHYLRSWDGPISDQTREWLAENDLRGLDNFLYLSYWDPTPGQ